MERFCKIAFAFTLLHLVRVSGQDPSTKVVNIGDPFQLVAQDLAEGCVWGLPNAQKGAEAITPIGTSQSYVASQFDRPVGEWTYKSASPICDVSISRAVQVDHGRWDSYVQTKTTVAFIYVFVQEPPKDVIISSPQGNTFEVREPGVTNFPIICKASEARTEPTVKWYIGDEVITTNSTRGYQNLTDDYVTVTDTLEYYPMPSHDGKILKCVYKHPAMNMTDTEQYEKSLNVTVHSIPDPVKDVQTPTLILGQPAPVEIRFHSNPKANSFQWNLHDIQEPVSVNVSAPARTGKAFQNGRYTFESIVEDGFSYTAKLTISELMESDLGQMNYLAVKNDVGPQNYTFVLENADAVGLSSGAVAGIVIGVLAVVILIGLVVYFVVKKKKDKKKKRSKNIQQTTATFHSSPKVRKESGEDNQAVEIEERVV